MATDGAGNWVAVWEARGKFGDDYDVIVSQSGIEYAALGDSYSSGEGVPFYFLETDTSTNQCHRSWSAYGFQIDFPGVSLGRQQFLACSGAKTINVLQGGEPPQSAPLESPQLDQRYPPPRDNTFIVNNETDMVTISIGGNDLGFGAVLTICLLKRNCVTYRPFSCIK